MERRDGRIQDQLLIRLSPDRAMVEKCQMDPVEEKQEWLEEHGLMKWWSRQEIAEMKSQLNQRPQALIL